MPIDISREPQPTWTFDQYLDQLEAEGEVAPPFNDRDRALARAAAAAQYFLATFEEMPARLPRKDPDIANFFLGIYYVRKLRDREGRV